MIGLGREPRELAVDVGAAGELAEVRAPGLDDAFADAGLRAVVEDEGLVGMAVDE